MEVVYEKLINFIDLENMKTLCSLLVFKPNHNEVYMIDRNVSVEVVKIQGKHVFPLVDIGHAVFEGSKLCYVVTKKYEVRVVKSAHRGVVFYVGETFPEKGPTTHIIIVGEDDVIKLTRSC